MRSILLSMLWLWLWLSLSAGVAIARPRSVVMAPHGMVATSHPLAAQIGLEVLRKGGNAVDAAIATNAAMGLMEPMSCGVGGDLFALVWDAKTKKLYGLNASGRSPYAATRELFAKRGLKQIPNDGPLSWSVPGAVDGWEALRSRFGTRPLAELLLPAIEYAEQGFPVTEVIASYWRFGEKRLARTPEAAATFLRGGRAPRAGELFKNPGLARTYREIASGGRDGFYRGRVAREIVAYSQRAGGLFSQKDFEDDQPTWVEPISTTYRGYEVWELSPNGQGLAALEMLNLLEGFEVRKLAPADWWHLLVEVKKLAFADRARWYADPDFVKVPVAQLLDKRYAAKQRARIDMKRAAVGVASGELGGDTIYLTVVDKDRNAVSLIQSNYAGFGSGLVPGGLGFALQNRGTLFALDETHANRLEPHRRPFHTIIPSFVTRGGKPWLSFGVMGGDMQPQGHVEVLVNLIDFGMNVQEAGEAARIEHVGSATPTGLPEDAGGGKILAEPGIPDAVIEELGRRGHQVERVPVNGGGFQGILFGDVLQGGSEPRKDGCAVGY
jgi:gamma-glutamyltranspeptidase/glutathione hydrolase